MSGRRGADIRLRQLAGGAIVLAFVSVLAVYCLPAFQKSTHAPRVAAGGITDSDSSDEFIATEDETTTAIPATTTAQTALGISTSTNTSSQPRSTVTTATEKPTFRSQTTNAKTACYDTDDIVVYKTTTYVDPNVRYPGGLDSSMNTWPSGTSRTFGLMWMSIEQMQKTVDRVELYRYSDAIKSGCVSQPTGYLSNTAFYGIMAILKQYDWYQYGGGLNPYECDGCNITVIGSNTVFTYLGIGRDEKGRAYVFSDYDNKVMYPSEADFNTIDTILRSNV